MKIGGWIAVTAGLGAIGFGTWWFFLRDKGGAPGGGGAPPPQMTDCNQYANCAQPILSTKDTKRFKNALATCGLPPTKCLTDLSYLARMGSMSMAGTGNIPMASRY